LNNLTILQDMLRSVYDELQDSTVPDYDNARHDFVFHITECIDDMEELLRLFDQPREATATAATQRMVGFLYHVVPHLNAATRLLLGKVPDTFAGVQSPDAVRKESD